MLIVCKLGVITVIPDQVQFLYVNGPKAQTLYCNDEKAVIAPALEVKIKTPTSMALQKGKIKEFTVTWTPGVIPLPNLYATSSKENIVTVTGPDTTIGGAAIFTLKGVKAGTSTVIVYAGDETGEAAGFLVTVTG